jgi:heme-degrading monooxygenase HmoA
MHGRVTTLKGSPDQVDEAFAFLENKVLPRGEGQKGFKGILTFASRDTGFMVSISLWESREDMEATRQLSRETRSEGAETLGIDIVSVEECEARVVGGQLTLG